MVSPLRARLLPRRGKNAAIAADALKLNDCNDGKISACARSTSDQALAAAARRAAAAAARASARARSRIAGATPGSNRMQSAVPSRRAWRSVRSSGSSLASVSSIRPPAAALPDRRARPRPRSAPPSASGSSGPPCPSAASSARRRSAASGQRARRASRAAWSASASAPEVRRQQRFEPQPQLLGEAGRGARGADGDQHRVAVEHARHGEVAQFGPVGDVDQHAARLEPDRRPVGLARARRRRAARRGRRRSTTMPPARSTRRRLASAASPSPSTITGWPATRWKSGSELITRATRARARRR